MRWECSSRTNINHRFLCSRPITVSHCMVEVPGVEDAEGDVEGTMEVIGEATTEADEWDIRVAEEEDKDTWEDRTEVDNSTIISSNNRTSLSSPSSNNRVSRCSIPRGSRAEE